MNLGVGWGTNIQSITGDWSNGLAANGLHSVTARHRILPHGSLAFVMDPPSLPFQDPGSPLFPLLPGPSPFFYSSILFPRPSLTYYLDMENLALQVCF